MTNPFAPLMVIMIPVMLFSAMMLGLSKINNDEAKPDFWLKIKRKKGKTFIGIKIIPVIMVIYISWVYFSNEMWHF